MFGKQLHLGRLRLEELRLLRLHAALCDLADDKGPGCRLMFLRAAEMPVCRLDRLAVKKMPDSLPLLCR